jgi:hypothetical protein
VPDRHLRLEPGDPPRVHRSSEPANGVGDGDTAPDVAGAAFGTDDPSFELRSEGQGGVPAYTITCSAIDGSM